MIYQYHPPFGRAGDVRNNLPDSSNEAAPYMPRRAPDSHGEALLAIRQAADAARFSLRVDPRQLDAASEAYGLALPRTIGGTILSEARVAICLGPDEWYLLGPLSEEESIECGFASLYATTVHSLVNIGHREIGIEVSGAAAAFALQSAIAFDVKAMPVGSGCRTLIDKVQIILLREAADRFRIEVWHSFADHVWHLLQAISREIELGL
ncbi:MAG TPA: sarcosine oxidase subunit gamma family protein [Bosea sp. (in: a-proteobacteria)]|jgi:sarcosine oxidase subunit gamma|nr:sarcosine oxidase subunit gamma family protein [Bosea sp. (in: a-proteobacteria)]